MKKRNLAGESDGWERERERHQNHWRWIQHQLEPTPAAVTNHHRVFHMLRIGRSIDSDVKNSHLGIFSNSPSVLWACPGNRNRKTESRKTEQRKKKKNLRWGRHFSTVPGEMTNISPQWDALWLPGNQECDTYWPGGINTSHTTFTEEFGIWHFYFSMLFYPVILLDTSAGPSTCLERGQKWDSPWPRVRITQPCVMSQRENKKKCFSLCSWKSLTDVSDSRRDSVIFFSTLAKRCINRN